MIRRRTEGAETASKRSARKLEDVHGNRSCVLPHFIQMRDALVVNTAVLAIVAVIVRNLGQSTSAFGAYVEGTSFVNDGHFTHLLL